MPVTGPPIYLPSVPQPPRRGYGLESAAILTPESPDGPESPALRGVIHDVDDCGRLACWPHDCDEQDGDKFGLHEQTMVTALPFTVVATSPDCQGIDLATQRRARDRAMRRLQALGWTMVEAAVLSGMCGASPYLVGPPDGEGIELVVSPATEDGYTALADWSVLATDFTPETPAGTDPVPRADALAAIEWGMRDYGSVGIIHAPSWTYPYFWRWEQREGSRLVTQIGTRWAFGRGYWSVAPGTPDPEPPDEPPPFGGDELTSWIYGTGAVRVWRSPIVTPRSNVSGMDGVVVNPRQNIATSLAEQTFVVSIQCPYIAVNVDLRE